MQKERQYLKLLRMKRLLYSLVLLVLLASCSRNPLKVNVSDVKIDLKIKHLDVDLLKIKPDQMQAAIPELKNKYGEFFDIFTYRMIGIGGSEQPNFIEMLNSFVADTLIQHLKSSVPEKIDTVELRSELEKAFQHYRYYFKEKDLPVIATCISGFNQSIVTSENLIGISLEKYMGSQSLFYERLGLPVYKRRNMHPEKIVPDVMYAWAVTEWPKADNANSLLSQMIHEGKMLYFVDAMLPDMKDSLKIGFTKKQMDFCKKEEAAMWTYLAEHKLLYTTDRMSIKRFIDDGPYTSSFSDASPARTGDWIGWQIVRSFMTKHPEFKLNDLMNNQDSQSILNQSGYQP
jgi:gliding motility-associated lipoprotein GldB